MEQEKRFDDGLKEYKEKLSKPELDKFYDNVHHQLFLNEVWKIFSTRTKVKFAILLYFAQPIEEDEEDE